MLRCQRKRDRESERATLINCDKCHYSSLRTSLRYSINVTRRAVNDVFWLKQRESAIEGARERQRAPECAAAVLKLKANGAKPRMTIETTTTTTTRARARTRKDRSSVAIKRETKDEQVRFCLDCVGIGVAAAAAAAAQVSCGSGLLLD